MWLPIFAIVFLVWFALKLIRSGAKGEDKYWNGPMPSRLEEKRNKERVFKIIEQFPDGQLATKNPEYKEEYLESIDLDLPEGITTSK